MFVTGHLQVFNKSPPLGLYPYHNPWDCIFIYKREQRLLRKDYNFVESKLDYGFFTLMIAEICSIRSMKTFIMNNM